MMIGMTMPVVFDERERLERGKACRDVAIVAIGLIVANGLVDGQLLGWLGRTGYQYTALGFFLLTVVISDMSVRDVLVARRVTQQRFLLVCLIWTALVLAWVGLVVRFNGLPFLSRGALTVPGQNLLLLVFFIALATSLWFAYARRQRGERGRRTADGGDESAQE